MTTTRTLDLDAIEATLEAMPRIPRFPAYFHDMRLLIEEVKRLRTENEQLRVENEVVKALPKNRLVVDLDKSQLVHFPQTYGAVGVNAFGDWNCFFCHHKNHADMKCNQCSCKSGIVGEIK